MSNDAAPPFIDKIDRRLLAAHLAERRYEEAWDLLEEAVALHPDDGELLRARKVLEPHVAVRLAASTRLSSVPRPVAGARDVTQHGLGELHQNVLEATRQCRTVAEALGRSPHGRVGTLRALRDLKSLGLLDLSAQRAAVASPPPAIERGAFAEVDGLLEVEVFVTRDHLLLQSDDAGGGFVELCEALRLLEPEQAIEDIVAEREHELLVLRPLSGSAVARVRLDAEQSSPALARLQVAAACHKLESGT
ncbi:MAG: hypothetical protein QM756_14165 [Polyangiaceae bacterium]